MEEITVLQFEWLHALKHPSLYRDRGSVDEDDLRFCPRTRCFILFGPLSCVNSDITSDVTFSHRRKESIYEGDLKWEIIFDRETIENEIDDEDNEEMYTYQVNHSITVIEPKEEDEDDSDVGIIRYSYSRRPPFVHPVTGVAHFSKSEYVNRVYFGCWRGMDPIDYLYRKDTEVLVNYAI